MRSLIAIDLSNATKGRSVQGSKVANYSQIHSSSQKSVMFCTVSASRYSFNIALPSSVRVAAATCGRHGNRSLTTFASCSESSWYGAVEVVWESRKVGRVAVDLD